MFTVVNPGEKETAEKAGITYHKFTYHDAMAEIQNLGSGDEAQKGTVDKTWFVNENCSVYKRVYFVVRFLKVLG